MYVFNGIFVLVSNLTLKLFSFLNTNAFLKNTANACACYKKCRK